MSPQILSHKNRPTFPHLFIRSLVWHGSIQKWSLSSKIWRNEGVINGNILCKAESGIGGMLSTRIVYHCTGFHMDFSKWGGSSRSGELRMCISRHILNRKNEVSFTKHHIIWLYKRIIYLAVLNLSSGSDSNKPFSKCNAKVVKCGRSAQKEIST